MVEVIPSINVPTFEEVKERIARVEPYVKWCHLDITDGVFSKHLTWHDPADLLVGSDPTLEGLTLLKLEAHLMVVEPEKVIEQWFVEPVERIIVHIEAVKDMDFIIQKCRDAGMEIGLAINPETLWDALQPWCGPVRSQAPLASADSSANRTSNGVNKVDMITVLTVKPGPSGQKMSEDSFDKIAHLRRACPGSKIEIDGGINPETARKAKEAGADILVAGAYIFNSPDIKTAIESLVK